MIDARQAHRATVRHTTARQLAELGEVDRVLPPRREADAHSLSGRRKLPSVGERIVPTAEVALVQPCYLFRFRRLVGDLCLAVVADRVVGLV